MASASNGYKWWSLNFENDAITSNHMWVIDNFSSRPNLELTAYLFSPQESLIRSRSYPGCISGKDNPYGCDLLLTLVMPRTYYDLKIMVECSCSFLNAKNDMKTIKTFHLFHQSTLRSEVFYACIKRTDIMKAVLESGSSELLRNQTLVFFCNCTDVGLRVDPNGATSRNIKDVTFEVPKSTALVDLEMLLATGKLSDFTICAGDEKIQAHKTILAARSPVFMAMFDSKMDEAAINRVEITDIKPNVIRKMLQYMYTDEAPNLEEMASGLLMAAAKYDLKGLKVMCAQALSNSLTTDNAADTLILADRHSEQQLKDRAMEFIVQNLEIVIDTPGCKLMAAKHLHLIKDISFHQNSQTVIHVKAK